MVLASAVLIAVGVDWESGRPGALAA